MRTPAPRVVSSRRITGLRKVAPRKRRVHARTGRLTPEVMRQACKAVKRHRGAAGRDQASIPRCEAHEAEHLVALRRDVQSGASQAIPLKRVSLPKAQGVWRPWGIRAGRCRGAQEVIRALRAPIVEPTFPDSSHGLRRHRRCHTAIAHLVAWHRQGCRVVVEADLTGCFDRLPPPLRLDLVAGEMADGNLWSLITTCLQAGVREDGEVRPTGKGPPPGGVMSPLLATIVLHHLAWRWEELGDTFVRYADEFVVLGPTKRQAERALEAVTAGVEDDRGWTRNPDKTRLPTFGPGCALLGSQVTARTIRMGGQAAERFKRKRKA
jgi:RNA-directed DNA polymerase